MPTRHPHPTRYLIPSFIFYAAEGKKNEQLILNILSPTSFQPTGNPSKVVGRIEGMSMAGPDCAGSGKKKKKKKKTTTTTTTMSSKKEKRKRKRKRTNEKGKDNFDKAATSSCWKLKTLV